MQFSVYCISTDWKPCSKRLIESFYQVPQLCYLSTQSLSWVSRQKRLEKRLDFEWYSERVESICRILPYDIRYLRGFSVEAKPRLDVAGSLTFLAPRVKITLKANFRNSRFVIEYAIGLNAEFSIPKNKRTVLSSDFKSVHWYILRVRTKTNFVGKLATRLW